MLQLTTDEVNWNGLEPELPTMQLEMHKATEKGALRSVSRQMQLTKEERVHFYDLLLQVLISAENIRVESFSQNLVRIVIFFLIFPLCFLAKYNDILDPYWNIITEFYFNTNNLIAKPLGMPSYTCSLTGTFDKWMSIQKLWFIFWHLIHLIIQGVMKDC